jgi:hypothetical protein
MKYIKLIIVLTLLNTAFSGCSYVSDYIEGQITDRASFSIEVQYSGGNVNISWDKTDTGGNFAGIEIYRTSDANDEYANYELVASRNYNGPGLDSGTTQSYTDTLLTTFYDSIPASNGIYFYRVAFIHWDEDSDKRDLDHGYTGNAIDDYNNNTDIDAISGYGKVVIP